MVETAYLSQQTPVQPSRGILDALLALITPSEAEARIAAPQLAPTQDAPEWARIAAQLLPLVTPATGATGAALSMAPQQQPESSIGSALPWLLTALGLGGGAVGMMSKGRAQSTYGPELMQAIQRYFGSRRQGKSAEGLEHAHEGIQRRVTEDFLSEAARNNADAVRTYAPEGYATRDRLVDESPPLIIMSNLIAGMRSRLAGTKPGQAIPENATLPVSLDLPRDPQLGLSGARNVPSLTVGRSVREGPAGQQIDRSLFIVPDSDDFAVVHTAIPAWAGGSPFWEILSRHPTIGEATAAGLLARQRLLLHTQEQGVRLPRKTPSGGASIWPFQ